ncbi:hypothetical protein [Segnochrobactrum spirostomi]|uniref:Uncharacterized protein n=1 Tax=Segnochrobactrum spirostomi TaxID=2608987 RepID=A0A6A7Y4N2_9HYPH|nr:hypothetical protein [Segnochrobactrum spirostomi]MQT12679.1 hypothetical protein [Segnochrobactrum spirostomi]
MNTFSQNIPLDDRTLNAVNGGTFQPFDLGPEIGAHTVEPLVMGGADPGWTPINTFPVGTGGTHAPFGNAPFPDTTVVGIPGTIFANG